MSESKIKQDPKNARLHSEVNKDQINKSLKDLGAGRSVVIDNEDYLIAGNGVYEQAEKLGLKTKVIESDGTELVVIKRTDLNYEDEKRRKLAIADNATSESSDWNFEELTDDEIEEWGIEEHQEEEIQLEAKEDDFVEEVPEIPITVLGDLYEIGEHRLLCGDSTDSDQVAKLMNGEKADMVFTDPPYNVAFNGRSGKFDVIKNDKLSNTDFEMLIDGMVSIINILNPQNYYIWCNWKFYGLLQDKMDFKSCIVWAKNVFGLGRGYRHQHEFCLFNGKIDNGINNESDLWEVKKDSNYMHPTQKPVELASRALNNHKSNKNIVDLFSGSGLTFIASHQLERKCYGMELDPKYCDVIVKRMLNLDSKLTIKRNGIDCTEDFKTA